MTTTERVAESIRAFALASVSHQAAVGVRRPAVVDNPGMAWAYSDQSPYSALRTDLVDDYRALLDLAATELIGPVLATVWEQRGYTVTFGTHDEVAAFPLDDALYHSVWDDAASLLDPDLIVRHAGLDDIRHTYSRGSTS